MAGPNDATGDIGIVSAAADGTLADGYSASAVFSPDGTKVAFYSSDSTLVPGAFQNAINIYVKTLATGAIQLVSAALDGTPENGASNNPVFSPDGTEIAFRSEATNLVPGNDANNGLDDVYIKNLKTGDVQRVSTAADGTQGNSESYDPVFSPDGTTIAFYSTATNLVPGGTHGSENIFVKNLKTGVVSLVATVDTTSPEDVVLRDTAPVYSPDSQKIAFWSNATDLVPGDTNGSDDVFVKDLTTGDIQRISVAADGTQGNDGSYDPVFSPDGTKIAFWSLARNLVSGDSNGVADIFVKDLKTGVVTLVSAAADGTQGDGSSSSPVFSPDGTKIAFWSYATNLVPGDTNETADIFVKDLVTGAVQRVSTGAGGTQSDAYSVAPVFSPDGTKIIFTSVATDLVSGANLGVFIKTLTPGAPVNPVAVADSYTTPENRSITVSAADGVLQNDTATDGHPLTAVVVTPPPHGTLTLNSDGSFTYTPKAGYSGRDSFTYKAIDGAAESGVGTVTIKIDAVGDIELVSAAADGTPGNSDSGSPTFSPDGGLVAFSSLASNLVPGDTNGRSDIFVKDLTTGKITLVSTNADGVQGNSSSGDAAFSPDGSKIAFDSSATNLVPGSADGNGDIFVKDLTTGEVTLVSVSADGAAGNAQSLYPVFSPDGTKIAFYSKAENLVAGDNNGRPDIFVKDLKTGVVTLVSTAADGTQSNNYSTIPPVFSPDGTQIAFVSMASNLVPGDTNGSNDIFIKDLKSGGLTLISTASDGTEGNAESTAPAFSPDGSKIAFESAASNLVPGDTNGFTDIFVKDLKTGEVTLVSTSAGGTLGNGSSYTPVFSQDGTKIEFASAATNLVSDDTNGEPDIFVKDLVTGEVTRIPAAGNGTPGTDFSAYSGAPVFSQGGAKAAFTSPGPNIVPGSENYVPNIFVKDLTISATATGQFSDGYIAGALVFIDANGNGVWDTGEAESGTDGSGRFTLPVGTGTLVATGGFDIATRLNFLGTLSAPSGSAEITPLTTLIVALQSQGVADAAAKVLAAFGLDPAIDLTTLNPISATSNGDANGTAVFLAGTEVMDTLAAVAAFLGGAAGQPAALYADALAAIAEVVAAGGAFNLSDPATITAIIDAGLHGTQPDVAVVNGVATIIAALNSAAQADASLTGTDALVALSAIALTAQGSVSDTLLAAGQDPAQILEAAHTFTGDALTQTIEIAKGSLGDVDGPGKNNPPVATPDQYTATANMPLNIPGYAGVLSDDRDPDGDALAAILTTGPQHGALTFNPDGSFTYTASADYIGTDSFSYQASDGALTSAPVTVTLDVGAPQITPVAVNDSFTLSENASLTITLAQLFANDQNIEDDTGFFASTTPGPQHGTLSADPNGGLVYTPDQGYSGADSFTYYTTNGAHQSNTATVFLTVTPAQNAPTPVAVNDSFTLSENASLTITLAQLFANDQNIEDDTGFFASTTPGPQHGTLSADANGGLVYTPDRGYSGADSFTYYTTNGAHQSNTATVFLTVTPAQNAPTPVAVDDSFTLSENASLTITLAQLFANDQNIEDDTGFFASTTPGPQHGTLSADANGGLVYTPDRGYSGADSFTYYTTNGAHQSNTATVSLTVASVTAKDDTYYIATGAGTGASAATGILANDTAPDGGLKVLGVVDKGVLQPQLISSSGNAYFVDVGSSGGLLSLNPDGSFSYGPPNFTFVGTESFTYRATDADGSTADATITFKSGIGTGQPVTAKDDTYYIATGTGTGASAATGILANDTAPDGGLKVLGVVDKGVLQPQLISSSGNAYFVDVGSSGGLLSLNPDGSFSYGPPNFTFVGTESFTYRATDADGSTADATITFKSGSLTALAEDGYLVGATVGYLDTVKYSADGTIAIDTSQPTATTGAGGAYSLAAYTGTVTPTPPIVLHGGTDSATGLAFTGTIEAANGSAIISPLTTVVYQIANANGDTSAAGIAAANQALAVALGLPTGTDFATLDPQAGTLAGNSTATSAFVADNVIASLATLLKAAGASNPNAIYGALASAIASGGSVSLMTSAGIASLATSAGVSPSAASAIGSIVSATSTALTQALTGASSPTAAFNAIAGSSLALQQTAAAAISGAASSSDPNAYSNAATGYTQQVATLLAADMTVVANRSSGSGTGDVHMVTFQGLHYDFMAVGEYTLARSTSAAAPFDVQIRTAVWGDMASVTTGIAAEVGGNAIRFELDGSVRVNGAIDTALGAVGSHEAIDGGTITRAAVDSYVIDWSTGESLSIVNRGAYFDETVTLSARDGAGSVAGLLGTNTSQATDIQLANGTVLNAPTAADLLGAYAESWSVAGGHSLLTDTSALPIALSNGGNEATPFNGKSFMDLAHFDAGGATLGFREDASGSFGTLSLQSGQQQTAMILMGQYASGSFGLASDGHGGTTVDYVPPKVALLG